MNDSVIDPLTSEFIAVNSRQPTSMFLCGMTANLQFLEQLLREQLPRGYSNITKFCRTFSNGLPHDHSRTLVRHSKNFCVIQRALRLFRRSVLVQRLSFCSICEPTFDRHARERNFCWGRFAVYKTGLLPPSTGTISPSSRALPSSFLVESSFSFSGTPVFARVAPPFSRLDAKSSVPGAWIRRRLKNFQPGNCWPAIRPEEDARSHRRYV